MRAVITRCKLRDRRISKGLSIRQLATMLGINRGTLSNYERMESMMSLERMALAALILDCTLDDLYDYELVTDDA